MRFKSIPLWLFIATSTLAIFNQVSYYLEFITGAIYLCDIYFAHREVMGSPRKSHSDVKLAELRGEIERVKLETSLQDVKNEKSRRAENPTQTTISGYKF